MNKMILTASVLVLMIGSSQVDAGRTRYLRSTPKSQPVPVVRSAPVGNCAPITQSFTPSIVVPHQHSPASATPAPTQIVPVPVAPAAPHNHTSLTTSAPDTAVVKSCCKSGTGCCASKPEGSAVTTTVFTPDEKPLAKDEKTLTGKMACAKCGLKMAGITKCTNALTVAEGDKAVTYLLDDNGNGEEYHKGLCGGGKKENVNVTGTITEKDGQKAVKPSKVEAK